MDYKIEDLIDMPLFQSLQDKLNDIYTCPSAIIDNEGKVHTATGWQDICTKFHRINPDSCKECIISDKYILDHIQEADPAVTYNCPHGLTDSAIPIIIEGKHLGNFFIGQFFLEPPNIEFFKNQAKKYGFDEKSYLEAVNKVPLWSQDRLDKYLIFIKQYTETLAHMGLTRLKEKESHDLIKESRQRYQTLFNSGNDAVFVNQPKGELTPGTFLEVNDAACTLLGYSREELLNLTPFDTTFQDEQGKKAVREAMKELRRTGSVRAERTFVHRNGHHIPVEISARLFKYRGIDTIMTVAHDITERKKAEDTIRQQDEFLNKIIESLADPFYVIDAKDYIVKLANSAVASGGTWQNRTCYALTHHRNKPCTGAEHACPLQEVKKTKKPVFVEHIHYDKDGSTRNVEVHCHPILNSKGNVTQVIEYCLDVTERRKAEQIIRTQAEVSRNMADGAYIIGLPDVIIRWASSRFEDMFGYAPGEMIGRHVSIVNAPTDLTSMNTSDEIMEAIRRTGEWHGEVNNIKKDGTPFWCQASVSTFTHPEYGEVLLAVHTDITERKKAEEALRDNEERYRTLFNSSNDAVFVHHPTAKGAPGIFIEVNEAACRLLGYTKKQLCKLSALDIVTADVVAGQRTPDEYMKDILVKKSGVGETVFLTKDGRRVPTEISTRLFQLNGQPTVLTIVRDITERKRAETEQQKVEKLESLGVLAGGIAHDFNNILTGIVGNISLARRYVEPGGEAEGRLVEAEKASLRARDLTQQLLTFAKGGVPIIQITSILEVLKESAGFALRGSNVRCELSLPDDLWMVEADATQLNQVIANLVINADEAMPEGGVLKIGARNMAIGRKGVLPLARGDYVEITVQDRGIGISKEHLGRIFDPYFTTKQKGSGLGLATAFSIIKNHGGHIAVKSELAVGTTFCIYLPALAKQAPAEKKEEVVGSPVTGKGRILVMDDDETIRELLGSILTCVGYDVEMTEDGVEAIKQYKKAIGSGKPFAAVILDLTIPGGLGGKGVIKKLLEIDPGVKAIVSSGYSNDPIMADFKRYGFSEVAVKPYKASEIAQKLHSMITSRK